MDMNILAHTKRWECKYHIVFVQKQRTYPVKSKDILEYGVSQY